MRASISIPSSDEISHNTEFYGSGSSKEHLSSNEIDEQATGEGLKESPSYIGYIEMINEFLQNKAYERASVVNKKREAFGIYSDCFGINKKSAFFSEKERGTYSLRYSPNGNWVVAGFGSGTLKLYDSKTYSDVNTLVYGRENGYPITCIRFLTNNSDVFYVSSAEGFVLSYNIETDNLSIVVSQGDCEINAIDINTTNEHLLTAGSNYGIKVYDLSTTVLLSSYKNITYSDGRMGFVFDEFHSNRVHAVKFLENPFIFLSGGWDKLLKMWDLRTKYGCVMTRPGPHISGDAIDFKGNVLLTGSWEAKNSMQVRDLRSLKLVKIVVPSNAPKVLHGVYTYATQFYDGDNTGDLFLHASLGYKSLDVISISENIMLHSFVSEQSCFSVSSHDSKVVFGGSHNIFNFVAFYMNILVPFYERPVTEELTGHEEEEQSVVVEEEDEEDIY